MSDQSNAPTREELGIVLSQIRSMMSEQFRDLKLQVGELDKAVRGQDGLLSAHIFIAQLKKEFEQAVADADKLHAKFESDLEELRNKVDQNDKQINERWWKLVLCLAASGVFGGYVSHWLEVAGK